MATPARVHLTNQWNDLLLRQVDPYASAKYQILLRWLGDLTDKRVLVVGSGGGEFAALLARKGARVTAIDIAAEHVELTSATARQFEVELETVVASIAEFAARGVEGFDVVAATDVIEHIEDERQVVAQLRSLVRADGRLIVSVPALPSLYGYHDEVLGHFRRYSKRSLRSSIETQFLIQRLRYYGFLLIPVALVISRWLRRPYPVAKVGETSRDHRLLGRALRAVFGVEKLIPPPLGTSLLLLAHPRP